jgi:DNA adenine methylase
MTIAKDVREWAIEHGDNPKLRIALCGYEGEHDMPDTWQCVPWKAGGGYAASAGNHENAHKERIWFSPACLPVHEKQRSLFAKEGAA